MGEGETWGEERGGGGADSISEILRDFFIIY